MTSVYCDKYLEDLGPFKSKEGVVKMIQAIAEEIGNIGKENKFREQIWPELSFL
jgi:hypothetical protein